VRGAGKAGEDACAACCVARAAFVLTNIPV
jgi:hypothetical protein